MSGPSREPGVPELMGNRAGMTLVEVLVATGLFIILIGLVAVCFVSSISMFHGSRQTMRMEELGRLFVAGLEDDMRAATIVRVNENGSAIAFKRRQTDELVAYEFDDENFVLKRYVRRLDSGTVSSVTQAFPDEFSVKGCSFSKTKGFVAVCLVLADRDKQYSSKEGDAVAFQGRVALRMSDLASEPSSARIGKGSEGSP